MSSAALFWLSVPFLLPQGLYVRLTAPRFAGAAGPAEGAVGDGPEMRLVAIGDSIIAGVGARDYPRSLVGQTATALAAAAHCRVRWEAHGVIGATSTALLTEQLPRIDASAADVILVSVGVNDTTALTSLARWRNNLRALFARLREASPDAVIALTGLPPMGEFPLLPQPLRYALGSRAAALDAVAREVVGRDPQAVHVPVDFDALPGSFAGDGYHPSEPSYVEFGRAVAAAVLGGEAGG